MKTQATTAAATAPGRTRRRPSRVAAIVRTARPWQWPKNLLVFAAPLAGDELGRGHHLTSALAAFAAFVLASSAVYFVNDVADAERDKAHPIKRRRPVAAGDLPRSQALLASAACAAGSLAAGPLIGAPRLSLVIAAYLCLSLMYSLQFKQVPALDVVLVASGFTLRALGGAVATRVPPSTWFLTVCSLGALLVAIAKRSGELRLLGPGQAAHRPVLRFYTTGGLRLAQRACTAALLVAYVFWALGDHTLWMRSWHLASVLPLAAALVRFDWLAAQPTAKPVEDLLSRDVPMLLCEAGWLVLFVAGL